MNCYNYDLQTRKEETAIFCMKFLYLLIYACAIRVLSCYHTCIWASQCVPLLGFYKIGQGTIITLFLC